MITYGYLTSVTPGAVTQGTDPFVSFFWFKFLGSFQRSYEGSNTIIPAVNIAKVIMILKIVFMFFGIIVSIVAVTKRGGAMDIKAAYDNKYGAPGAGRTKVFLRYFFVNAVTGEKSADILREVELGATNDPFDEGNQG